MNCRLFPQETKLVRSHIFPKWIYEDLKAGADHLKVVSSNVPKPKRNRIGVYDDGILSLKAEQYLQKFDSYGASFFRQPLEIHKRNADGEIQTIEDFNFVQLKTFILSLLWRSSISTREEFKLVNLGPKYEALVREEILNPKPDIGAFPIFLTRFKPSKPTAGKERIFANPFDRRDGGGKRFYEMGVLDWRIRIIVDRRPNHGIEDWILVNPDGPLHVLVEEFDGSRDDHALKQIFQGMRRAKPYES